MPKGRTVFEYSRAGGFPCRKEGYLLYFDGRVYTVSQAFGYTAYVDDFHDEAEHYHLIATCKPLADEVKKFIRERRGIGGGIGRFPSYVIPGYLLKDRTVIGRHIRNAIQEGEIDPKVVCAKFARMGGFY